MRKHPVTDTIECHLKSPSNLNYTTELHATSYRILHSYRSAFALALDFLRHSEIWIIQLGGYCFTLKNNIQNVT